MKFLIMNLSTDSTGKLKPERITLASLEKEQATTVETVDSMKQSAYDSGFVAHEQNVSGYSKIERKKQRNFFPLWFWPLLLSLSLCVFLFLRK